MRAALALLCALALAGVGAGAAGARAADSAAARPARNLKGWYPPADPESASVRLGRRPNAPKVALPLSGGAASLEALAREALVAASAGAPESLLALAVTKAEFETILWPEMPQSRPATGILPIDAWRQLSIRLTSGSHGAASDLSGGGLAFARVESGGVREFRNYRLHRRIVIVARDAAGVEHRLGFVRSAVERGGRFKIASMED